MISNIQSQPALTSKGNFYNPTRLGATVGAVAGGLVGASALTHDIKLKEISKNAKSLIQQKGVKNVLKGAAKFGTVGAIVALTAGTFVGLGKLIGNLIDAPKNQELREQADGMEILRARLEAQDYMKSIVSEGQNLNYEA